MDEYGVYVYWAFGITLISCVTVAVLCCAEYKKTCRTLRHQQRQ